MLQIPRDQNNRSTQSIEFWIGQNINFKYTIDGTKLSSFDDVKSTQKNHKLYSNVVNTECYHILYIIQFFKISNFD